MERRVGSERQSQRGEGVREWNGEEGARGLIARGDRGLYLYIVHCAWAPEFLVTPLLMGRSAYT